MTRSGENFKLFEVIFSIWQNCEPALAKMDTFGQSFTSVIGQIENIIEPSCHSAESRCLLLLSQSYQLFFYYIYLSLTFVLNLLPLTFIENTRLGTHYLTYTYKHSNAAQTDDQVLGKWHENFNCCLSGDKIVVSSSKSKSAFHLYLAFREEE